jgi:hypothetical protein
MPGRCAKCGREAPCVSVEGLHCAGWTFGGPFNAAGWKCPGCRGDELSHLIREKKAPTKPGFYWALWLTAAPGTHEGSELTPARKWEVVEVWENHIGTECEADKDHGIEKFGVAVPGVRETQWLENFKWDVGPSGRPEPVPEPGYET